MRILVVSDIHSNLAALDAVIMDAGNFDVIWCLGDIVGYGPQPNECIARLREFSVTCLAGNHDLAVIDRLPASEFSQDARDVIYWTRERLSAGHSHWLESLPTGTTIPEYAITLVHASPRDPIWEYVISTNIASDCFKAFETQICLNGHTHLPMIFRKPSLGTGILAEKPVVNSPLSPILDRLLLNPGSVGQPRDDDARAAFAIFEPETVTFTFHRVQYDVSTTQRLMKQARFPDRLIRRLRFGE